MDGAFCDYSEAAKLGWLADLAENKGAINCEMEAAIFLSLCQRAGVSATVACVALLNRKGLTTERVNWKLTNKLFNDSSKKDFMVTK